MALLICPQVGVNYDPMVAKVITHGANRAGALRAMHDALSALQVAGLPTNLEFMKRITQNQEFQEVRHVSKGVQGGVVGCNTARARWWEELAPVG
jgi:acetyl/propionyl-CoA carboxylase alpha subunit